MESLAEFKNFKFFSLVERRHVMAMNALKKLRTIQSRFPEVEPSAAQICSRILGERKKNQESIWTLLHACALNGEDGKCFTLLRCGSEDLNKTNEFGETALHLACANPDIPDEDGYSPLHTLALQDETDKTEIFARLLLEYGANINSETNFNETPLHLAIYKGIESLVKVLLDSGASFTAFDVHGRTAIDISFENKDRYPTIYDIVAKHVIIHYCSGFRMNIHLFERVCNTETHQNFKRTCEEELHILKSTFAGESTVSFYDILVLPTRTVAKFILNPNIVSCVGNFYLEESVFRPILLKKYKEAIDRSYGIKLGILATREMFPFLPDVYIDELFQYLDIEDFNNLYKANFF
ncbi:hypothetical protein WA026_014570 [Henosepilachna vigintioctopunctata]|uniref:Uncharacterized protein n=1 Tax=Henosepilachna vigintioctopunctata TaxID=420089 RepID=A0AAW1V6J5_9CUCU